MQGALAVASENDGLVGGDICNEAVEGGFDVGKGEVQSRPCVGTVEKERAKCSLPVARRPYLPRLVERAGLATYEETRSKFRIPAWQERRIPAIAEQVRGRMDVEYGRATRLPSAR